MTTNHVHGDACVQRLPGLEGPCDHMATETQFKKPVHWPPETCPLCQPDGKAPVFPTLRRECSCLDTSFENFSRPCGFCAKQLHGEGCERCQGLGWVADVTLEKLLVAMWARHYVLELRLDGGLKEGMEGEESCIYVWNAYRDSRADIAEPPTPEAIRAAAVIAACRALEPETGE